MENTDNSTNSLHRSQSLTWANTPLLQYFNTPLEKYPAMIKLLRIHPTLQLYRKS